MGGLHTLFWHKSRSAPIKQRYMVWRSVFFFYWWRFKFWDASLRQCMCSTIALSSYAYPWLSSRHVVSFLTSSSLAVVFFPNCICSFVWVENSRFHEVVSSAQRELWHQNMVYIPSSNGKNRKRRGKNDDSKLSLDQRFNYVCVCVCFLGVDGGLCIGIYLCFLFFQKGVINYCYLHLTRVVRGVTWIQSYLSTYFVRGDCSQNWTYAIVLGCLRPYHCTGQLPLFYDFNVW